MPNLPRWWWGGIIHLRARSRFVGQLGVSGHVIGSMNSVDMESGDGGKGDSDDPVVVQWLPVVGFCFPWWGEVIDASVMGLTRC
jgi:hypothetical protein